MALADKNFFLNLEDDNAEEMNTTLDTVFQNEMAIMSKDNSDYVKNLRNQIAKVERVKSGFSDHK